MKKIILKPISILRELRSSEPGYEQWLMACSRNLGGSPKDADDAYRYLEINAAETSTDEFDGEEGVVAECNAIREDIEKSLNTPKQK